MFFACGGLTNFQVPFWDFIFHRFYPFWKTHLTDRYFYKPASLVWTMIFIRLEYSWLGAEKIVNFTRFGKLVYRPFIFGVKNIHPNDSCLYKFGKLVSPTINVTRFAKFVSVSNSYFPPPTPKKNSFQSQVFGEMKWKIKKTERKNKTIRIGWFFLKTFT